MWMAHPIHHFVRTWNLKAPPNSHCNRGSADTPLAHQVHYSYKIDGEAWIAGLSCYPRFAVFVINYLARCAYSVKSFATLSLSVVVATSIPYARITARSLFWCALRNSLGIVRSSYRSA